MLCIFQARRARFVARLSAAVAAVVLAVPALLRAADGAADGTAGQPAARPAPALVVVVVVDQLRRDRARADLPGGLGRLVREGLVFANATLGHAASETCPGHAALLTGRHPGPIGVPANYFVDRASGAGRYCVEDDPEAARVLGSVERVGRSPRLMRADALGDWMKRANPASQVFSVSAKDRAAIALGGQHPDGAFWLNRTGELGFTTSRYYARELPGWVRTWNGGETGRLRDGMLRAVPESWQHEVTASVAGRIDDYRAEASDFGRTSGHPLHSSDLVEFVDRVYRSPFMDDITLEFAQSLVAEYALGEDEAPDLLAISLSATDSIGHLYGPESHEAADALQRLDAALAGFLEALELRVGRERLLVALSSDHGVLPLPEWLADTRRATCPVGEGRVALDELRSGLFWHLHFELGPWYAWPRDWVKHAGTQITVDRARAGASGREVDEVVAAAEAWLEQQSVVERVWTASELAASAEPMARLFRNSRDPERSGDLAVQVKPGCLVSLYASGTTHGAPYAYDRDVPLVLWGGVVDAGVSDEAVATVDLGPTLAHRLGIEIADDLDGRALVERR